MKNILRPILMTLSLVGAFSCKKYLSETPDKKFATATTLESCEALLDDNMTINSVFPGEAEILSDNYYATEATLNSLSEFTKDYYLWKGTIQYASTWLSTYKIIAQANLALEGLREITPNSSDVKRFNETLGNAYFLRGYNFYILSQLFAVPFGEPDVQNNLGIPLRITTNVNVKSSRSSIEQTYSQIISDLKLASRLLSVESKYKTRPNRPTTLAILSRVYLSMGQFDSAASYAKKSLLDYDRILDFNSLDPTAFVPITRFNPEVLFHAQNQFEMILQPTIAITDSNLIRQYEEHDLRKLIFYMPLGDGTYSFRGGYEGGANGGAFLFGGVATDEVYLNLAECLARIGKIDSAMAVLNKLLVKRYETGFFVDRTATSINDALTLILAERRKELIFRGIRWTDLRRLRKDPQFAIVPKRIIDGITYELVPDSKRYTLLLPAEAINNGGLTQNP